MSRPIRNVTIEPFKTGNGSRLGGVSYLYRVRDAAGDVILERSRVPLHDAARVRFASPGNAIWRFPA